MRRTGLIFHSVLVSNSGEVKYISPCGTYADRKRLVNYWKHGRYANVWGKSFVAKQPLKVKEGDFI